MAELEARADLEHQQRQPDLAQHGDRFGGLGPEQRQRQTGRDGAEQRRPEHEPGDNLAHRPGLPEAARDEMHRPRRADHHDQLEEDREKQVFGRVDR